MSNYFEAKIQLSGFIRAGVPLVVVRSLERHRVERMARELASENNFNIFYYTDAKQIQSLSPASSGQRKDVDSDPLEFSNQLFLKSKHSIVVLGDTRKLDQDNLYTRELLGSVHLARETRNTVIIVASEDIWQRLSHFGLFITLDFPDFDERSTLIAEFVCSHSDGVCWDESDIRQLATLTRGLSEVQIVNLMRSSLVSSGSLDSADIYKIGLKKEQLFTPVSNVTPVTVDTELKVAGLDNLKRWLARKKDVLFATGELLNEYNLEAPKGVLLAGVPGCGKSFSARVIASRWELPLFRFDIGSIYDKYVGESERHMQEALDYIDNVAPCIIWIDEIEKALSSNSGESDVGNRILGQFLFWLQESQARVFLVATANDITKLPPELFRKGRFSEIFFVDLPNKHERVEAIKLYSEKCLHVKYSNDELDMLADCTKGFSYSDIEQAIKDKTEAMVFGSMETPQAVDLANLFKTVIPISAADARIESIRMWGHEHAVTASMEDNDE